MSEKTVVTEKTLPVTEEQGSAPVEEIKTDTTVNDAAEMGHTLPISDDVVPGGLDWSEMAPVEEFDRISEARGVDSQPVPQEPELTDSMSKRITKLKQQEQEKIAGKDQVIAEKDAIIAA